LAHNQIVEVKHDCAMATAKPELKDRHKGGQDISLDHDDIVTISPQKIQSTMLCRQEVYCYCARQGALCRTPISWVLFR
jgi:hypothetical protein